MRTLLPHPINISPIEVSVHENYAILIAQSDIEKPILDPDVIAISDVGQACSLIIALISAVQAFQGHSYLLPGEQIAVSGPTYEEA